MEISPHLISKYDQRVALVSQCLDDLIADFKECVASDGETEAALVLAMSLGIYGDVMSLTDLVTVAVTRLARES